MSFHIPLHTSTYFREYQNFQLLHKTNPNPNPKLELLAQKLISQLQCILVMEVDGSFHGTR